MASDKVPVVLPRDLVGIQQRYFNAIVEKQAGRLRLNGGQEISEELERYFKSFRDAILFDVSLSRSLKSHLKVVVFANMWEPLEKLFTRLRKFSCDIETVFPGTATVESDFSVMNWEFDEFRSSLTQFSLEGILQ